MWRGDIPRVLKGSSVDLKNSPKRTMDARRFGAPTQVCNVTGLNPHNVRYSIQRSNSRNWKVWAAVDAEFDFSSSASDDHEFPPEVIASGEPLLRAVAWMNQKLAEDCEGTGGHTVVENGHVEVLTSETPKKVDLELLFWDTIISLEPNTRAHYLRTVRTGWGRSARGDQRALKRPSSLLVFLLRSTFDI